MRRMSRSLNPKAQQLKEWNQDFLAASLRSLENRIRYSFIHTYNPVLDDSTYRSFGSMKQYRDWCEKNLPDWLGYGRI